MIRQDYENLSKILDRASEISPIWKEGRIGLMMDIEFTNDIIPLDFEKFANADEGNFIHDVAGIYQYFNRATKRMDGLFVPRFAKHLPDQGVSLPSKEVQVDRETFLKSEIERLGWFELDAESRRDEVGYHDKIGDLMEELAEIQKAKEASQASATHELERSI
jgi:hypothetical protein